MKKMYIYIILVLIVLFFVNIFNRKSKNKKNGKKIISFLNLKTENPATYPIGSIISWSGEKLPDGWILCDGNNATPDLTGRFILGKNDLNANTNLCYDMSYTFDASMTIGQNVIFFKDDLYWALNESATSPLPGYPKYISRIYGIKGPIDSALYHNKKMYFFIDINYYVFNPETNQMETGYPKLIEKDFGIPGPIDSIVEWNGNYYIFKGKQYWKMNTDLSGPVAEYPKDVSLWGINMKYDTILFWNGYNYVFSGNQYYKLNNNADGILPGYPLMTKDNWFIDYDFNGGQCLTNGNICLSKDGFNLICENNKLTLANDRVYDIDNANVGGEQVHKLTLDEFPNHSHTFGNGAFAYLQGGTWWNMGANGPDIGQAQWTDDNGKSMSHNNLPPYYVLSYIMKIQDTKIDIPKGSINPWNGDINKIPNGWVLCDGTKYISYRNKENVIITPDLRGRFILGKNTSSKSENRVDPILSSEIGFTGGEIEHKLTINEMPSHSHNNPLPLINMRADGNNTSWRKNEDGGTNSTSTEFTDSSGASMPHNNLPPYYVLAYIMKL
jgi:microcystin-dependent protein